MRPQIFGGEFFAEFDAAEKLAEAGGDRDILYRVQTEQHDGALDRSDLSGQSVEGAVDDFENSSHQGGIVRDDLVQSGGGALGVFDGL